MGVIETASFYNYKSLCSSFLPFCLQETWKGGGSAEEGRCRAAEWPEAGAQL